MNLVPSTHPSPEELAAFARGEGGPAAQADIARHVAGCAACCQVLRGVPDDTLVLRLRQAAPPDAPGEGLPELPGYQVVDELGRGGMGVVYRAWQERLKRLVAVKMVLAGEYAGEKAVARLRVEAEAVARLQHPNIVQIHDVGEYQGRPYFALEYVDGSSLADRLGGRPLPAGPAAELVETLARAVHYAHQRGIVHRDLKPANVLLASGGRRLPDAGGASAGSRPPPADLIPKISDFSLAKLLVGGGAGQTQTGDTLGTPSYMAPEQAGGRAREVGPAADVYSLGAILYECLTGRPPFQGVSPLETLQQAVSQDPVPPRRLQPKLPRDLETVCLKCLQKEPRRRYASAAALAEDLRRFAAGEPILARPVGSAERLGRWCRRNPAVAALAATVATLLVFVAVGATLAALRQRALTEEARRERDKAVQARNEAQAQRQLAEKLLERHNVARVNQLVGDGDLYGALPWTVECLQLAGGDPAREEMHRYRLAAVLDQCPRFVQVWFHDGPVRYAEFSPDGRRVVTAGDADAAYVWDAATGERVSTLRGHRGRVTYVSFSPDGRRLVTAGADATARLWDAETGRQVTVLQGHGNAVGYATFGPDGRSVLTAGADATARLWDADTGRERVRPLAHQGTVRYAAFSRDGRSVVTAGEDGRAQVWEAATGEPVGQPLRHGRPVMHASFSPDGRRVVTASQDTTAQVWEVATGKRVGAPLRHVNVVNGATFSPDGTRVLTASLDATARLWDAATGELVCVLPHRGPVGQASFRPDGRRVVTASADRTARVWDAATGRLTTPLLQHNGAVLRAAFHPGGRSVVTASADGTARLWDTGGRRPRALLPKHRGLVRWASFSPDGRHVVTAGFDGLARVWDLDTGATFPLPHERAVQHAAFSPDSRYVVTAGFDGTARVWKAETGEAVAQPLRHGGFVNDASFSPDGRLVVTASFDGKARVWNAATGELVRCLELKGQVHRAAFSPPDGRYLVTAGRGQPVRLWDASTGTLVVSLPDTTGAEYAAFSPDGRRVVVSGAKGQVFEAATGEPVGRALEHHAAVSYAAFSPDGRLVVTASLDHVAQAWDVATGEPWGSSLQHTGRVAHLAFSPDGRRLVTASYQDGRVRVWEVATGEPISPVLQHPDTVWHASFSPDGRRVLTACGDGAARLWDTRFEDRPLPDLVLLAQVLAGVHMRAPGTFGPLERTRFYRDWAALWSRYRRDLVSAPPEDLLGRE
jgi:WD40 repeat protein